MSNGLSSNLEQLDALLSGDTVGDNAMGLSELDGFLAGMIVCPAVVMPQEWIRQVWGENGLNVDNVDDIEAANALVMARFKQLIAKLDQGAYAPVYDIDQLEQVVWPTWSGGFLRAMALRPEAWHQFGDIGGEDAQHAMFTMMRLCELGNMSEDDVDVSFEMDQHLIAVAPDLIPEAVQLLYTAKKAEGKTIPASLAEREMKVGRNDPCPCGSGKKYKNCCLNAA